MIRHIVGQISYLGNDHLVIDVQGVGYLIYTPKIPDSKIDDQIKLFTHQVVRENALDLYGFLTLDELEVFEWLLNLPKIGPKSAAQILHQADITLIKEAVATEDASHLAKLSGLGKKTAEKVVLGLKDKFTESDNFFTTTASNKNFQIDAIEALVSLGYAQNEARKIIQDLPPDIINTNEAVREALKLLSN